MTDLILLFLSADLAALLLLGVLHVFLPRLASDFATIGLSGLGVMLCLPALLWNPASTVLQIPIGPPGLSLNLALDPLSAFFLLIVFFCGTAVAAFAAADPYRGREPATTQPQASTDRAIPAIPLGLAGLSGVLLAGDAVTLALGLSLTSGAIPWLNNNAQAAVITRSPATLLAVLLLLVAVCLLAPLAGTPYFDAIRAAPGSSGRASAAVVVAIAGGLLLLPRTTARRRGVLEALAAGAAIPTILYLLIRLIVDLPKESMQAWWGFVLLLAGATVSIGYGWRAARHLDLDGAVACLTRRQAGLALIGLGLTVIAQSADLPDAASFGLAATVLLTIGSAVAATLASLTAYVLGQGAATYRFARLGGLLRSMPIASASLAASLLALSALPPAAGFAALWLLFQSVLSAPRTGGLASQLLLALTAAALALSAALATAAAVRLLGIAVLSRPRSVRGSAAQDIGSGLRPLLLGLSSLSMLVGALPGLVLKALADPMLRGLTGTGLGIHAGWATLSASAGSPGYSAMPVLALLILASGAVMLIVRYGRRGTRVSGVWNDGIAPAANLPFGDPVTQSAGAGFLPTLPNAYTSAVRPRLVGRLRVDAPASNSLPVGSGGAAAPRTGLVGPDQAGPDPSGASPSGLRARSLSPLWVYLSGRPACPIIGLWAILLAFGALLLVLLLFDGGIVHG